MKNKLIKTLIFLSLLIFIVTPVFANDELTSTDSGNVRKTEILREKKNVVLNLKERFFGLKEKVQLNLQEGKTRSCEARQAAVTKRMTSLTRMANNMETKFSSISARVQEYYTSKVVPDGKTLDNYDELIADINAKKSNVDSELAGAQVVVDDFTCEAQDPKSQLTEFRKSMQDVKEALKEYRTSIKNLIVAVKSLNGKENSE